MSCGTAVSTNAAVYICRKAGQVKVDFYALADGEADVGGVHLAATVVVAGDDGDVVALVGVEAGGEGEKAIVAQGDEVAEGGAGIVVQSVLEGVVEVERSILVVIGAEVKIFAKAKS